MATFIHGIAASENIDSSGERIIIAGLDSSSLERDGVFNYEHDQAKGPDGEQIQIKLPANIVGKVLKAKKIFSEKDCEDEHQSYFWQKCQVPFLYVMGELFDDYKDSAREVAGMFMYDADRQGKQEANVANFSVEGAKIEKKGMDITRCIARKITITTHPCNKAAIAEMVQSDDRKKDDIDSLFKTESIQIEVFKMETAKPVATQDMAKHAEILGIEPMTKSLKHLTIAPGAPAKAPAAPMAGDKPALPSPTSNPGSKIGSTKSGKDVMSHAKIHEYHDFNAEDHRNAALHHGEAANKANAAKNSKLADHHNQKMKLHNQAGATLERKANRLPNAIKARHQKAAANALLGKSLTAGSGMSAPSDKTGGEALAKEDVLNKPLFDKVAGHKTTPGLKAGMGMSHMGQKVRHGKASETVYSAKDVAHKNLKNLRKQPKPNLTKSEWLARAEQAFEQWDKKEEFRSFMQARMPHLAKGEVDAIGKTLALKKSLDAEKSLETMMGLEPLAKSEGESHAKVGDKVHIHIPHEGETLEGEVTHYNTKEMGLGGKELPKDDHSVYIKTTSAGKNPNRHGADHTYVMPAKHGKKNADGMHISPRKDKK